METKRGQDLQWASVSEKSRDVKRIVTSPLGKSENGCLIVVSGPTKVCYGMGERLERYEARGYAETTDHFIPLHVEHVLATHRRR